MNCRLTGSRTRTTCGMFVHKSGEYEGLFKHYGVIFPAFPLGYLSMAAS